MPISEGGRWSPQERIVSPGVFTRENDLSFLPQGISNIGGAIIAPFPSGPAYSPTLVDNQTDLETWFGVTDGVYYGPYSAKEYLKNQGTITVIRIGGLGGYIQKSPLVLYAVRANTERFLESSSLSGVRLKNCTITPSGSITATLTGSLWAWPAAAAGLPTATGSSNGTASAGFVVSASLYGSVDSGSVEGTTASFGEISFKIDSGDFNYVTAETDYDKVGKYFDSASLNNDIVVQGFTQPHSGSISLVGTSGSIIQSGGTYTINRRELSDTYAIAEITGSGLIGRYGVLDYANATESEGDKKVLAILANTAFDQAQNLYGFSGSVLLSSSAATVSDFYTIELNSTWLNGTTGNYQSASYGFYDFSIDPTDPAFITNVFGSDPRAGQQVVATGQKKEVAYTYKVFNNALTDVYGEMVDYGSWKIKIDASDSVVFDEDLEENVASYAMSFSDGVPGGGGGVNNTAWSAYDIREATTPFIKSQQVSPWKGNVNETATSQSFDLFRVHTLSQGTDTNTKYKVEISNVKLAGTVAGSDYGAFDVGIRAFDDTDNRPVYLELFTNCSMDPTSVNYVARKIGDRYNRINFSGKILEFGEYGNKSRFVRIEMTESPYPKSSVPYGFGPYATPFGGEELAPDIPALTYTCASIYSQQRGRYASGVEFHPAPVGADDELISYYSKGTSLGAAQDNKQYFAPTPMMSVTDQNVAFDLETYCGLSSTDTDISNVKMRRFVLGFQGGFDGQSPSIPVYVGDDITNTNTQGLDCSELTSSGSVGYKLAINALSNADEFDINLLWTPGIIYNYHSNIVKNAISMVENRGDAFYLFDIYQNQMAGGSSIDNVVTKAAEFDTSYAATYYPWIRIIDTNTNQLVTVPPSVVMPGVFAQNDRSAAEWFAPAGLNRGGIEIAKQVMDRLTHSDRDALYEGRVNPIVSFPGQGISVWGQKTLQVRPSALDRINVRRLLINLKKFIASSSKFLVFEQNVAVTRNRFLSIVNPYLESVQQRSGLYAFRVVMDENNNTPDIVDRNILYGQIYLQPTKTAEFILLDFNVQPSGAQFDF